MWRDRWIQKATARPIYLKQKAWSCNWYKHLNGNFDKLLGWQWIIKELSGVTIMGKLILVWVYPWGTHHILKINSQERSACGSGSGRGWLIIIKYTQGLFVLHNKGLLSREKNYQNPIPPEGKVFLPSQTPLAFLSYLRGMGSQETLVKVTSQGTDPLKDWDLIIRL